jgi:hypothetical protein
LKEENAENFQENANCLPLCFASLLRKHCQQIVNSKKEECSNASVEENKDDTEADPEVHSLNLFEGQISDEILKPETGDELIHFDSLPLCFNSFQILRGNLGQILVESHSVSHEVSVEPMTPSSKELYDPIADILDGLCSQNHFPFTRNDFKDCYDMDMIRQSTPMSCSVGVLEKNSSDQIQACFESLEDIESTCVAPGHEVELTDSECQEIGQVYIDPIGVYMEKNFSSQNNHTFPTFMSLCRFIKLPMMMIRLTIIFRYP